MKIIAVIPARYASTRFPAKLMQDLGGKTVILRTYEAAISTNLFDDVFVVTDSDLIFNEIISSGGKAIMSIKEHESGSDRIAEAVENMDVDVVINVQGDEFGKTHGRYLSMKHGRSTRIVAPLARNTRPLIQWHNRPLLWRYIPIEGSLIFEACRPFQRIGPTVFWSFFSRVDQ